MTCIASSVRSTHPPIGRFLTERHDFNQWWVSDTDTQLCRRILDSDANTIGWAIFDKNDTQRYSLRSGTRFRWTHSSRIRPQFSHYASVTTITDDTVALHSTALPPTIHRPSYDFWTVLRSFENQTLCVYGELYQVWYRVWCRACGCTCCSALLCDVDRGRA